jgi:hypothetical protein
MSYPAPSDPFADFKDRYRRREVDCVAAFVPALLRATLISQGCPWMAPTGCRHETWPRAGNRRLGLESAAIGADSRLPL